MKEDGKEMPATSLKDEVAQPNPSASVKRKPRQLGGLAGSIWIADDFDEPLSFMESSDE